MKSIMKSVMESGVLIAALVLSTSAFAAAPATSETAPKANSGLLKDFDTLGGNDVLLDKARELNPDARISVVQDRIVNRRNRLEIAPEFASVLGGDPYNKTNALGLNAYYHINPYWALGVKGTYAFNEVRPEGQRMIDQAVSERDVSLVPDIDYQKGEALALVNWFPIYGKMNLHDLGIQHFDLYAVAGGGQVFLRYGNQPTYTAGGGVGFWFSQHLTARAEMRWQTYEAQNARQQKDRMNLTVAGLQIGYLL